MTSATSRARDLDAQQVVALVLLDRRARSSPRAIRGSASSQIPVSNTALGWTRLTRIPRRPFEGRDPCELREGRLRCRVRGRAGPGSGDVLRRVHDHPSAAWRAGRADRRGQPQQRDVGVEVHRHDASPLVERELVDGHRRREHAGVAHEDVESAEALRPPSRARRPPASSSVTSHRIPRNDLSWLRSSMRRRGRARRRRRRRGRNASAVARPIPDAAPVTSAISPANGGGRALALQLRLLELPVLDVEEVALRQRLPVVERGRRARWRRACARRCRAAIAASLAVRPAVSEPELRVEDDPRRRVEHRERQPDRLRVALEVPRVLRGVGGDVATDHRHPLGADDVVGRQRAAVRERRRGRHGAGTRPSSACASSSGSSAHRRPLRRRPADRRARRPGARVEPVADSPTSAAPRRRDSSRYSSAMRHELDHPLVGLASCRRRTRTRRGA